MGANERLRVALHRSGLTIDALAQAASVDPKTCERWITQGRTPHRTNAHLAALALHEDMSYLWPALEQGRRSRSMHPDLVAIYATRADAPLDMWRALFENAHERIGILVYAAVFLHELWPAFNDMLRAKAQAGCSICIMLGDAGSPAVTGRGQEELYGHGIESRCRQALMHYQPLAGLPGIDLRLHGTVLYNSIYLGDDWMIVNAHRFGINAYATPVLHLRRAVDGGLFDGYAESFQNVWRLSRPAQEEQDTHGTT